MVACNVGDDQFKLIFAAVLDSITLDTRAEGERLKCGTIYKGSCRVWSGRGTLIRDEDKQKHVVRWTETEREGGKVKKG